MLEDAHRALLVSWDRAGDEVQGAADQVSEAVVARAWSCSCGWREDTRDVDGRFFRPPGDVDGRLRAARVRRSDRNARGTWDAHASLAGTDRGGNDGDVSVDAPGTRAVGAVNAPHSGDVPASAGEDDAEPPLVRSARAERARLRQQGSTDAPPRPAEGSSDGHRASVVGPALTQPVMSPAATTPLARSAVEIATASARVAAARAEAITAESALGAAVHGAREQGLSWRAIAAAAGIDHRIARARWGPPPTDGHP